MKHLEENVEQAIDTICALGCDVVAAYISSLRKGQLRPEYQSLTAIEREHLLDELQSIMSVYEQK